MGFIQDLLVSQLTDKVRAKLGDRAGTKGSATDTAINDVVGVILAGLQDNVKRDGGPDALAKTLDKNHDGSILTDVDSAVDSKAVQKDGDKIIGHIFGKQKDSVLDRISKKSGIPKDGIVSLMVALAPIILGKLGEIKKDKSLDADGVADEVKKQSKPGGDIVDIVTQIIGGIKKSGDPGMDTKNDTILNDLISAGSEILNRKKE